MKFSPVMLIILGIAALFVVVRILTPTPQQQMMEYYNTQTENLSQQTQQIQMQNMQMLNGMQSMVADPYQNGYNNNYNYYQQQMPSYQPNNGGYNYSNGDGYSQSQGQYYDPNYQQPQTNDDSWGW